MTDWRLRESQTTQDPSERTHYVYRAYDKRDTLLYVGCSHQPRQRWSQLKADPTMKWAEKAVRWRISGPYSFDVARRVERETIWQEKPRHNRALYITARRESEFAVDPLEEARLLLTRAGAWFSPDGLVHVRLADLVSLLRTDAVA
jgi:hypothetical protein